MAMAIAGHGDLVQALSHQFSLLRSAYATTQRDWLL